MQLCVEAYLDIETKGSSPKDNEVTVWGMPLVRETNAKVSQMVGGDVTADNILEALREASVIYTYNVKSFDLPLLHSRLGINLAELVKHHDLMFDCWRNNLYGGFKAVERQLSIPRKLTEVNGYEAVRLWWRYVNDYDEDALSTLLEYNKEDVLNLKTLRERLLP